MTEVRSETSEHEIDNELSLEMFGRHEFSGPPDEESIIAREKNEEGDEPTWVPVKSTVGDGSEEWWSVLYHDGQANAVYSFARTGYGWL